MRVAHDQVRAILEQRKHTHRVPVKEPGTRAVKVAGHVRHRTTVPWMPKVGTPITVIDGRSGRGRFPVLPLEVRKEPLGQLTLRDALAEGHKTTLSFRVAWLRAHDPVWKARWRRDEDWTPTEEEVGERYEKVHAHLLVWVVTFEVAAEARFMLPAARPLGSELGYTHSPGQAMRDEGPCDVVDVRELRPEWGADAKARHAAARDDGVEDRRRRRALANRVRQLPPEGLDVVERAINDELDDAA